jgi:ComF family protein
MDLFDLIFPKHCLGCNKPGNYICNDCVVRLGKAFLVCPACQNFSVSGATHDHCKGKTSLDGVVAIFKYEGVIKKAIKRIKYNFNYDIDSELVDLAWPRISGLDGFTLVPIPIHESRKRFRGFNQSEVLGENLAKKLNLGYQKDLLIRVKKSPQQVGQGRNERLRSIRGVFAVNDEAMRAILSTKPRQSTEGLQILLFDDVWTTGATLNEAAQVLKKAGAVVVWGLTIAR